MSELRSRPPVTTFNKTAKNSKQHKRRSKTRKFLTPPLTRKSKTNEPHSTRHAKNLTARLNSYNLLTKRSNAIARTFAPLASKWIWIASLSILNAPNWNNIVRTSSQLKQKSTALAPSWNLRERNLRVTKITRNASSRKLNNSVVNSRHRKNNSKPAGMTFAALAA